MDMSNSIHICVATNTWNCKTIKDYHFIWDASYNGENRNEIMLFPFLRKRKLQWSYFAGN